MGKGASSIWEKAEIKSGVCFMQCVMLIVCVQGLGGGGACC